MSDVPIVNDLKFNVSKFEGIITITMTPAMTSELLECLEDFDDFHKYPHMDALRRQLRGVLSHKGRSLIPNRQPPRRMLDRLFHSRGQPPDNLPTPDNPGE